MSGKKNLKITIVGFAVALNIVGAFIALNFRLPVYLDSIGTAIVGIILGPFLGALTGVLGSFISGITFDVYSLYYIPVQVFTGIMIGYFAKKDMLLGYKKFLSILLIALVISSIGAVITINVFDGLTSSGSSYILMLFKNLGMNDVFAAFSVQIITDYLDEIIACSIGMLILKRLPNNLRLKLIQ